VRIEQHVGKALDEWEQGGHDWAIMQAGSAVDGSAKRAYPNETRSGLRFKQFLRDHDEVLQLMGLWGLDVPQSRFLDPSGLTTPSDGIHPDVVDLIYHVHRCAHAHGDVVADGFELLPPSSTFNTTIGLSTGTARLDARVVIGILAAVVLADTNADLHGACAGYTLWWAPPNLPDFGELVMPIDQWWGREADFLAIADNHPRSYVTAMPGDTWPVTVEEGAAPIVMVST
jgi:hypothetical protein